MVYIDIIGGRKIKLYFIKKYATKEWEVLKTNFPNELKKIVDNGFTNFFIHETYDREISVSLNEKYCMLYSNSSAIEKLIRQFCLIERAKESYDGKTDGIYMDYMQSNIEGTYKIVHGGEIIAEASPYSIHLCDFWHSINGDTRISVPNYIDFVLEKHKIARDENELSLVNIIKNFKEYEIFDIVLKTNKKKIRDLIISKKVRELESKIRRIEKFYEEQMKNMEKIKNDELSKILNNLVNKYEIRQHEKFGWYLDVSIIPEKIIRDKKIYKIKKEFREKFEIKGLKIVGDCLYSPNKTEHPNVNNAYDDIGYKICIGDKKAKIQEINLLIEMLKTINLDSAFQTIRYEFNEMIENEEASESLWYYSW